MIADSRRTHDQRAQAGDEGPIDPFETATYIYLLARELAPMAAHAGLADVAQRLIEAGELTAQALSRLARARAD